MDDDVAIKVSGVSKKFSRNLKSLMKYGFQDIGRSVLGMNVDSGKLRNGEFWAVDDVSFELKKGEVLGLIGKNGSGKSTMLKMLNGIYMPDKGTIEIQGKVGALIEVGAGFHPMLTGRENIYINGSILGLNKKEIDDKFDDILEFADIGDFIDSPVRNYSSGMYVRLGFSVAVHSNPGILLVDEVLAVGDMGFQAKCLNKIGKIRKNGTSIILVTHNMNTLSAFADRAILFNDGKMNYHGEVSKTVEQYRAIFNEGRSEEDEIEKVVTSTDEFRVLNVDFLPSSELNPGESFSIQINYKAINKLDNLDVEIALFNEGREYFRCTNHLFKRTINLMEGVGTIKITIHNIPINNSNSTISLAIWKDKRSKILFWWRDITLKFRSIPLCMGDNYLEVSYDII